MSEQAQRLAEVVAVFNVDTAWSPPAKAIPAPLVLQVAAQASAPVPAARATQKTANGHARAKGLAKQPACCPRRPHPAATQRWLPLHPVRPPRPK